MDIAFGYALVTVGRKVLAASTAVIARICAAIVEARRRRALVEMKTHGWPLAANGDRDLPVVR
jgi:hypothetical protein